MQGGRKKEVGKEGSEIRAGRTQTTNKEREGLRASTTCPKRQARRRASQKTKIQEKVMEITANTAWVRGKKNNASAARTTPKTNTAQGIPERQTLLATKAAF